MNEPTVNSIRLEFINYATEALELMMATSADTDIEAELLLNALSVVVENDSYTPDNIRKFLGCIYMAQGIILRLRLQPPSEIFHTEEEM